MAQSESEPANSSSAEEEEVSSEGSESESEPDKTSTPPPSSKITKLTGNSSSDESDSDSESDTDKPAKPDPNTKPLPSNPTDHDQSKKPRSKNPTPRYSPPPLKSSTGKRPAAEAEAGDLKRVKKKTVVAVAAPDADNNCCGEKKQLFQRLWSEDNEIELIQGMINYVNEKGKDPVADVNDFHDFVKKSLHVDVTNKQVVAKARRLKKKYKNNVARAEKQSKVRSFSNPHEKKMYELSKSLWGNDSNKNVVMSSTTKKVNVKPKQNKNHKSNVNGGVELAPEVTPIQATPIEVEPKVVQPLRSSHGLDHGSMGFMITDEVIMKRGLELLSGPKKVEMEEKWKNLKVQELKHFLKKVELLKEQAEIVLNAMVKSGDN